MNTKRSIVKVSILRTLLVASCFVLGFSSMTKCDAQTIVGKWKGIFVKNYYSAEYAKQIGKSMEEKSIKELGNSEISFNTDHTFILTFTGPQTPQAMIMKGTWSVSGNELRSTLEPKYNPRNTTTSSTFSINGNTMVSTTIIQPPSRIIKTIATSERM